MPTASPTEVGLSSAAPSEVTTGLPTATVAASATVEPLATLDPAAGYRELPGWIVFEHFGQKPDGSDSDFDFDKRMIWMVHADGGDLHELAPGNPAVGKVAPGISPDGQTVAFSTWSIPLQIWTAPIDGGEPTLASTDCSGVTNGCQESQPAYSADGTRLAFIHFDRRPANQFSEIGIRDLATGDVAYLEATRFALSDGYVAQPSWSPDGSEIVYYRALKKPTDERPADVRLFVAATDGSGTRELPQPPHEWAADPDWSPDGSSIVFSTYPYRETEGWGDFPGHDGIWTVKPDGSGLKHLCNRCLPGDSAAPLVRRQAGRWTERSSSWGYRSWALMNYDGGDAAHINQPELTWFADGLGFGYEGLLQPTP